MPTIRLRLIAADAVRRKRLEDIFRLDSQFVIIGGDNNAEGNPFPDVLVADLAHPEAALPQFWSVIHHRYPKARLVAVVEPPIDEAALRAALRAGAYYLAAWNEPAERLCAVAQAAFFSRGYIPQGAVLEAMAALFIKLNTAAGCVQIGALRVELTKRQVQYRDQPLRLTALEFDLIAYLARNAGRTVPRGELLQTVWRSCPQQGRSKDQVKSAFKRLRDKIEPDSRHPRYLLTVHGEGYMMPAHVEE